MELIKIDTDHFVVVNKTIQPVNGYYYDSFINKIKSTNGAEYGEASNCWQITHSTQPLELLSENGLSGIGFSKIRPLNVFEVKELIGEVNVERKVRNEMGIPDYLPINSMSPPMQGSLEFGIKCYNQALEDNKAKRYTEEDLKYMFECGRNYQNNAEITFKASFEYLLQTKTFWQVEFIDGKLKLK